DKHGIDETLAPRPILDAQNRGIGLTVAFSPDGRRLVTGGEGNTVKIWDVKTGRELKILRGHTGEIYAVAISPDGRWVASGGEDSTVEGWGRHHGDQPGRPLPRPIRPVGSVAVRPRGPRGVCGSEGRERKELGGGA